MGRRLPITASLHLPPERTVTAAAEVLGRATPVPQGQGTTQPWNGGWQREAWAYRDTVGELRYASVFMANAASRAKLKLVVPDADSDELVDLYDEDGTLAKGADASQAKTAVAALKALGEADGGHGAILSSITENLFVVGECYLVGADDIWTIRSTDELRNTGDRWYETTLMGSADKPLPPDAYVARIYRPHPRYHRLADSPVRACLDILDELVLLTRQVRSVATSRIAGAGVYWIPSEISFSDDEGNPGDSFERRFMEAMMRPITQHGSAAEVVPMIARASAGFIKDIRHDTFDSQYGEHIGALRDEAIRRLAAGLDLPLEVVLGTGTTTSHWGAWQVDESTYKAHLAPSLHLIASGLTSAYLWPKLSADGKPSPIRIHADATELIQHPNRESAAQQAYGNTINPNFGISGEYYRQMIGVGDEAAPDDDEIAERIRQAQLVRTTLRITEAAGFGQLLEEEGTDINQASDLLDNGTPTGNPIPAPAGPQNVRKGPPLPPVPARSQAMTAAAELAAYRALERLGERLRGKVAQTPALAAATKGLAAAAVPSALGLETVVALGGLDVVNEELASLRRFCETRGWDAASAEGTARRIVESRLAA